MDSDHYFIMSCAGEEADATPGHGSAHHRVRDPVTGVTRRWFDSIRSQRMGVSAQLTRERVSGVHDRFDGTCPLTADHPGTELQWSEAWAAGTSQVRSDIMTNALTQQRRGYRVYDESELVAVGRRTIWYVRYVATVRRCLPLP